MRGWTRAEEASVTGGARNRDRETATAAKQKGRNRSLLSDRHRPLTRRISKQRGVLNDERNHPDCSVRSTRSRNGGTQRRQSVRSSITENAARVLAERPSTTRGSRRQRPRQSSTTTRSRTEGSSWPGRTTKRTEPQDRLKRHARRSRTSTSEPGTRPPMRRSTRRLRQRGFDNERVRRPKVPTDGT